MFLILLKDFLLYVIFLVMADLLLIHSLGWQVADSEVRKQGFGAPPGDSGCDRSTMLAWPWSQGLDLWGIKPHVVLPSSRSLSHLPRPHGCGYRVPMRVPRPPRVRCQPNLQGHKPSGWQPSSKHQLMNCKQSGCFRFYHQQPFWLFFLMDVSGTATLKYLCWPLFAIMLPIMEGVGLSLKLHSFMNLSDFSLS